MSERDANYQLAGFVQCIFVKPISCIMSTTLMYHLFSSDWFKPKGFQPIIPLVDPEKAVTQFMIYNTMLCGLQKYSKKDLREKVAGSLRILLR